MVWFEEAIPLFLAVKFDGKSLRSREFFEAALNCRNIYRYVWGGGLICRQLEKDLNVSTPMGCCCCLLGNWGSAPYFLRVAG